MRGPAAGRSRLTVAGGAERTDGDLGGSVEFRYGAEDFVAAYALASAPTRRTWVILALVALTILAFLAAIEDGWMTALSVWLPAMAGTSLGGLAYLAIFVPWRGRRVFARYPLARIANRLSLQGDGLRMRNERGDMTMSWSDFTAWRASRATILLYTSSEGAFVPVPTRLAAQGFPIDALKAALAREVGPLRR